MVIFIICCALVLIVSFSALVFDENDRHFLAAKNLFIRRISRMSMVLYCILGHFSRIPLDFLGSKLDMIAVWGINWILLIAATLLLMGLSTAIYYAIHWILQTD